MSTSKPRVWPAFVAWGAAVTLGVFFAAPVLAVAIMLDLRGKKFATFDAIFAHLGEILESTGVLLASIAANSTAIILTCLLAARLTRAPGTPIASELRLGPSSLSALRTLGSSGGTLGISLAFFALIHLTGLEKYSVVSVMSDAFSKTSVPMAVVTVSLVGGLGPLGEELLFRGFMQPHFHRRWGRGWGIAISAAAFGFTHLDPIQGTFAFAVGVYLGWLATQAGSIRPSILSHVVNNSFAVVLPRLSLPDGTIATLVTGAIGLALVAVAFVSVRRPVPPDPPTAIGGR